MKRFNYREISFLIVLAMIMMVSNNNVSSGSITILDEIRSPMSHDSTAAIIDKVTSINKISSDYEIKTNSFAPTWIDKQTTLSPSPRQHSAMTYDSFHDKTVIFGGSDGSDLGDTWVYDYPTNTWENMNPASSPSPMNGHAMVYDPETHKVVLFGSGQTWTYDYSLNNWVQQSPQVSPSTRTYHSMIYNIARKKVIMIGGTPATFETWEMDTTSFNWTNRNPITPIPRLFAMAASYDQANDKIIVFGGQNSSSQINAGDTYAYDYSSNEWTLLNPLVDPSDRRFYGKPMEYDPRAQKSLFFGGRNNTDNFNETWTFDYPTSTWELLETTGTPSPRWIHTMVFNIQANKLIMFGGSAGGYSDQTYELTAFYPIQIISPGDQYREFGTFYTAVSWQLLDLFDAAYEIKLDTQTIDSGNFVDGQTISLVPFGLGLGSYALEMIASDIEGNSASDAITLHVVEVESPVITGPEDLEIEFFDFDKNITWVLEDLTPANYNVTQNGTVIAQGNWQNGDSIIVDLDPLPLGHYIFEITVTDAYSNFASDTVLVDIIDAGVPTISSPSDVFTTEGTTGNKIVWEVDDDNPTEYILERNNELLANDTYQDVFFLEVNLDGYTFGVYNFTLTLYDENGHSVSDFVEVQIFPINEGAGNTSPPRSGGGGGGNFIDAIDPQIAAGAGAFVAVFGGAYFVIRRRSSSSF